MRFSYSFPVIFLAATLTMLCCKEKEVVPPKVLKTIDLGLTATEVVPPVAGRTETAQVSLIIREDNSMGFYVDVKNLSSGDGVSKISLLKGAKGTNGTLELDITGPLQQSSLQGEIFLTRTTFIDSLINKGSSFYVQLYTQQKPSGLLRAQLN